MLLFSLASSSFAQAINKLDQALPEKREKKVRGKKAAADGTTAAPASPAKAAAPTKETAAPASAKKAVDPAVKAADEEKKRKREERFGAAKVSIDSWLHKGVLIHTSVNRKLKYKNVKR